MEGRNKIFYEAMQKEIDKLQSYLRDEELYFDDATLEVPNYAELAGREHAVIMFARMSMDTLKALVEELNK